MKNQESLFSSNIKKSYMAYVVGFILIAGMFIVINKQYEVSSQPKEVKKVKVKPVEIKKLTVSQKKQRFLEQVVPPLQEVYEEEWHLFYSTQELIKKNPDDEELLALQEQYNADNNEELLMALKPHPRSVTLAQAAMESAWGQSRFFKEANNLFGVWSFNKNEPRIAAGEQRGEKTIWLKKYDSIKDAIKDYYLMISRSWAFKEFRELNYQVEFQNPYLLVEKLHRYSEKKELYGKELSSMINYNKFVHFDEIHYERPKKIKKAVPVKEEQEENLEKKVHEQEKLQNIPVEDVNESKDEI